MSDQPISVWERWPDAWRLVGLILSSVILAIVLVLRGPAPVPVVEPTPSTPVAVSPGTSPLSPPPVTPPSAPQIVAPRPDEIKAGAPIIIEGTASPGERVRVYDGPMVLGEAQSDEQGRWRLEVGRVWTEGPHELRVVGLNEAGEEVIASEPIALFVPAVEGAPTSAPTPQAGGETPTVPPTPTVPGVRVEPRRPSLRMHVSIDEPRSGQTMQDVPQVTGVAPAGAIVRVYEIQRLVGQTVAEADGAWQLETTGKFPAGDHLIWAEALAEDGTLLGISRSIFFTVSSSPAPSLELPTSGTRTRETRPSLSGTGEPGAVVRIYADTRPIAEAAVDESGRWKARPEEPLPPGRHIIRAVVVDEAGRPKAESQPVGIVVVGPTKVLPLTGGEHPEPTPAAVMEP